jgi:RimJ/RimL family protein N-acetyltransferase
MLDIKTLEGEQLRLEPYAPSLKEPLREALDCDAPAWDLFAMSGQGPHFETWWDNLNAQVAQGKWIAYAIRDKASDKIIGTSSFLNLRPDRQQVEIGGTFLHPSARAGDANPAAKLLMLEHAFDAGVRRVELITDARNLRSQAAIAKLGAQREGVLRRDRVTWTGHVRDSVLFSILDIEWPDVKRGLQQRVNRR